MTIVNTEKNITLRGIIITATLGIGLTFSLPNASSAQAAQKVDSTAMTAAHNQWRSKTGVPTLTWSNDLAVSAQQWADQLAQNGCKMKHSTTINGENIYWAGAAYRSDGTSSAQEVTDQNVVDAWGNEVKYYDYENNTCHSVCGHYTQVVWQSTTEVGCGMASCSDKAQIWVCQYNPRGNMVGQKPYSLTKKEPSQTPTATEKIRKTSIAKNNSSLDQEAMIAAHNKWRSKVGVPGLIWSDELARSSQEWIDHLAKTSCSQGHSGISHGENIYQAGPAMRSSGSSRMQNITAQNVVAAWGNEINDYDYSDNSCHSVCGHYTQVVWKTTREVGCAMAACGDKKTQLWACQYSPAGNMVGQKPY
jgi:pathogenesis-related protein 1